MSVYCYLCCVEAREVFHVKDSDSKVYVNLGEEWNAYNDPLSQFLEKHAGKELRYVYEDDCIGEECPCDEWKRFEPPKNGFWACGRFVSDKDNRS